MIQAWRSGETGTYFGRHMTAEEKQKLVAQFNSVGTLIRLLNDEVQRLALVIDAIKAEVADAGDKPA